MPQVRMLSYADNWGWSSTCPTDHDAVIALTLPYVEVCGMKVDWQKSWAWATHGGHSKQLNHTLQTRVETRHLTCITCNAHATTPSLVNHLAVTISLPFTVLQGSWILSCISSEKPSLQQDDTSFMHLRCKEQNSSRLFVITRVSPRSAEALLEPSDTISTELTGN